jgi:hypothetical protein
MNATPPLGHPSRFGGVARALLLSGSVWAGATSPASAADDLPRSPACRTAVEALETAESALADAGTAAALPDRQRQRATAARLQPLRQRVADACLGGLTTSPPPSQRTLVLPPAPPRAELPPRQPRPPLPPVTPLPRVEPPLTITHCNAAACIASDGSTLTRVGPSLVGPRGACNVQGAFLRCP